MNENLEISVAESVTEELHRIKKNVDLLCHVTEREYKALVERDTLQLESIAADKRTLMSELENQHKALLASLNCSEADLPQKLALYQLESTWLQLKQQLKQAKQGNDRNGILLNTVVHRVQKELALLTGQTTLGYEQAGTATTQRAAGSLGRA